MIDIAEFLSRPLPTETQHIAAELVWSSQTAAMLKEREHHLRALLIEAESPGYAVDIDGRRVSITRSRLTVDAQKLRDERPDIYDACPPDKPPAPRADRRKLEAACAALGIDHTRWIVERPPVVTVR